MISVCYTGTATDYSGYGNANRMDITSLFVSGVNLTTEIIRQVPEKTNYGLTESIAVGLQDRKIPYKVKIIHLTPDLYENYSEKGIYNIGRLFFEANKLPDEWIAPCNNLDEIWTSTPQQEEMIRKSNVKTPVYLFSQAIDVTKAFETIEPFKLEQEKDFIFYSIFQFIPRKSAKVLVESYWKEFSGNDKVTLLIKTYGMMYSDKEYERIKSQILQWQKDLHLKHYPKVFLVQKLLTDKEMIKLHKLGDVFINPSASEGFCRPLQEAMLYGKPVISPDSGITNLMTSSYYHKVESKQVQAEVDTTIPWYQADMYWDQPLEKSLRTNMRKLYDQHGESEKTKLAQQYVVDNFGFLNIGEQMKIRLDVIVRNE